MPDHDNIFGKYEIQYHNSGSRWASAEKTPSLQLTGSGGKIIPISGIPAWNTEFSTPKARSSNFGLFYLRARKDALNQIGEVT